jgi:methyl-accepting chemotaxis protein
MKFSDLGLTSKIMLTMALPLSLAVVLTLVSIINLRDSHRLIDSTESSYRLIHAQMKVHDSALDMRAALDTYLLSKKESLLTDYKTADKDCAKHLDTMRNLALTSGQKATLIEAQDALETWKKDFAEPSIKARKQVSPASEAWDKFDQSMKKIESTELATVGELEAAGHKGADLTERIMIIGTLALIIFTIPVCYMLAKSIIKPLAEAVSVAEGIAGGDLSQTLDESGKDEVGALIKSLNVMVGSLRNQTQKTSEGVNVLASSASEISTSVAQLASSATETSSSVTETVSTVEELLQTARLTSDKARNVAQSAQLAVQIANEGEQAIEETVTKISTIRDEMASIGETVQRLNEQSQSVEDIINSVRDLADQSNLLAVNASIEAAKAGEQGKGFAVVAAEIKSLSDRSREATEQVRDILEDTRKWIGAVVMATEQGTKAVVGGVKQSKVAGDSIRSLCKSVMDAAESATLIQASNEQQTVGIDQVSNAMAYIDQAIRQNVAGATQLEEAARQISDLGHSLKELVERYRM